MELQAFAFLSVVCLLAHPLITAAVTNQQDVTALNALAEAWPSSSLSWIGDPCVNSWLGVTCDTGKTMVTRLALPNMGLSGTIPSEIGNLMNLEVLDLSYNAGLKGQLPTQLFQLTNLTQLFLQNCGLVGSIAGLENLKSLTYLAINNNFFSGTIPTNMGQLSQLYWFDISSNQFTGDLPLSLSLMTKANHFHFQVNQLSGVIPTGIFSTGMPIIHLLLYNNSFQGAFPADIGNLTQLDILRLDFNSFTSVPESLTNLTTVTAMQLDHNKLTGDVPDLSTLPNMQILDLGHNQFTAGPLPSWVSKLSNLSSIAMEESNLEGQVPAEMFSSSNIESVLLGNNSLNGTLDLRQAGPSLTEVDLHQNSISGLLGNFTGTLNLQGNLICQYSPNQPDNACNPTTSPTSSSILPPSSCSCSAGTRPNPTAANGSCLCAYPVSGLLYFTALKVTLGATVIPILQAGFQANIPLVTTEDQVSISIFSSQFANISIFPDNAESWDTSQANAITFLLSSKAILFDSVGPYEFIPLGVYSVAGNAKSGLSVGGKVGIGVGVAALAVIALIVGSYAVIQKRRADKAEEISKPLASWVTNGEDSGDVPKLKGARLFTVAEIKKATNNFSKSNEIGVGGYGKVYIGVLPSGDKVAIKRSQASSQQGAAEFRNEIELLSRVHHRNLLGLVGFCFEDRMLIYEYIPNGTLREALSGSTNVRMNWQRRLEIALGSAKGLAYLHTEANPPIIHRDIKSANILLDEKLNAKVADFGLSKLAPDDGDTGTALVTQVKGTLGYLDPEYYTTQRLSDKSDVYSFGVVLLELITAKQPIEQGKFIVKEVRTALLGGLPSLENLLDPELMDCPRADLEVYVNVALRSVEERRDARPSMSEVAKELEALVQDSRAFSQKPSRVYKLTERVKEEPDYSSLTEDSFKYSGVYTGPVTVEPK